MSSTSSGPSTSSADASSAADSDLAAVVALVRAAGRGGGWRDGEEGELRCTFDDLFCTVSSADKHLTRTDVRAAVAYLRTEYQIVVDRHSKHPGMDVIIFLED